MPVLPSRFAIDQVWEQKEERGKGAVKACMQEDGCVFARNEVYRLGGWGRTGTGPRTCRSSTGYTKTRYKNTCMSYCKAAMCLTSSSRMSGGGVEHVHHAGPQVRQQVILSKLPGECLIHPTAVLTEV